MRSDAVALCALAIVTLAICLPARDAPFVYEDAQWLSTARLPSGRALFEVPHRQLTEATLAGTIAWVGAHPWAFHLGNLVLHLATGLVLWVSTRLVAGQNAALVALAAFWWHGLNTEAVIYTVGRSDLLLTLCLGLALWAVVAGRVWLAVVPVVLSLGTKEIAVIAPVLVGWSLLMLCGWRPRWWLVGVPIVGLAGLWWAGDLARLWAAEEIGGTAWWPAFALQCTALWRYLSLFVWPFGLSIDHDFYAVSHLVQFGAVLATIGLCGVAWTLRARLPIVTWAIGWLLICVAPRMALATPEVLAERQMYLPMFGLCLALGAQLFSQKASVCDGS